MPVHIDSVTSTVRVTDSSAPLPDETMRQVVAAVIAELASREARTQRAARDRSLGADGRGQGACGCGGGSR